jgi:hypothetical protein
MLSNLRTGGWQRRMAHGSVAVPNRWDQCILPHGAGAGPTEGGVCYWLTRLTPPCLPVAADGCWPSTRQLNDSSRIEVAGSSAVPGSRSARGHSDIAPKERWAVLDVVRLTEIDRGLEIEKGRRSREAAMWAVEERKSVTRPVCPQAVRGTSGPSRGRKFQSENGIDWA